MTKYNICKWQYLYLDEREENNNDQMVKICKITIEKRKQEKTKKDDLKKSSIAIKRQNAHDSAEHKVYTIKINEYNVKIKYVQLWHIDIILISH